MKTKKYFITDKYRSCLSFAEIDKFKTQITKQDNSPVCRLKTTDAVVQKGIQSMKSDGFHMVKGKIDV